MDIEKIEKLITDYRNDLAALAEEEDGRDILAFTGEKLAAAVEMYRETPESDRPTVAIYVMFVAEPHVMSLYDAGMQVEALATNAATLMTLLIGKLNPHDIPVAYISYLQKLYVMASDIAENGDLATTDTTGHLFKIMGMTAALATTTYHALAPANVPAALTTQNTRIEAQVSTFPTDEMTFGDKPIGPTMAIDVAADIIARLMAFGLEW